MPITPPEAAAALEDVARTQRRAEAFDAYQAASGPLMLWGAIWIVCNLVCELDPTANWIWAPAVLVGVLGGMWLSRGSARRVGWRGLAMSLSLVAFVQAVVLITRATDGKQLCAIWALVVATCYVALGLRKGTRFIVAGYLIGALTLAGWLILPQHFFLWMAAVGGGSLILAGVWLRML